MFKTAKIAVGSLVLLALAGGASRAQDIVPLEYGSRAICASPALNDPRVIQEALMNTQMQHPGIFEAVRQVNLEKGTLDLKVGDQNLFWVYNIASKSFDTARAELKAIGAISYIWVALGEWNNGHVTATEVNAVFNALELSTGSSSLDPSKGILQIDRQVYGDPPNINSSFQKGGGDGKTHFLLCDIQDGWTGTGGYVAGFFFSVDVDPSSGAVPNSNKRDMLYIDTYPGIYYAGNRRTTTALSTLAHEFQHLIHWNYDPHESTFFNEGLSEYAEFLCGFDLRSPAGYFGNTNVSLTVWNNTLEDYSRATLWTRYVAEQYGLRFIKNFVQNPAAGIFGFEQSLSQSGYSGSFASTMNGFFTANWMGSSSSDSAYHYKGPVNGRPTLKGDYPDPNVQQVDTVFQQGAEYISFASSKNFKVTFTLPAGVQVRAIESGPASLRIRDVSGGTEFTSPDLGTLYSSVVFVVMNTQSPASIYSYSASGDLLHVLAEESHDSGTPHTYSAGFAPYLGFGNNSTTLGMAVRFQPAVKGNILHKARLLLAFNQEFANGTAQQTDSKNFVFHVWDDKNGRPGADLITPFLVSVDRNLYPLGSFVDVDLSAFQSSLTNLAGPVYLGFMEDVNDSVGTYVGVDNFVQGDYSYVYRGPNYTRIPNTWETMSEVSAVNNHTLDGFNLMIRAVFEYSDSSTAPSLAIGYLQNPLFSENIDVIAASKDDLRPASLSGAITQAVGSGALRFYAIPGTFKAFIDTSQQLKGNGTVSLRVRAAKKYGIFYTDTTVAFAARLVKVNEQAVISTPSGNLAANFEAGSLSNSVCVTAFEGVGDPGISLPRPESILKTFSLGPTGIVLNRPTTISITRMQPDAGTTLALLQDGKWLSVPTVVDQVGGKLSATISRLGVYGVTKKSEVDGQLDGIPAQFALSQNYPNPFNPTTAISYELSANSSVTLQVFDILGRMVALLINGEQQAGIYTVRWDGSTLPSGVYFYRLSARPNIAGAEAFNETKKMVLMK